MENKIFKVLFSGENENLRFSYFRFQKGLDTFLKQVLRESEYGAFLASYPGLWGVGARDY